MGSIAAKRIELTEYVTGEALAYYGANKRRNRILNDLLGDIGDRLCVHADRVACTTDIKELSLLLNQGLDHIERCGPIERRHPFPLPARDLCLNAREPNRRR